MKVAMSNIAWSAGETDSVAATLPRLGVSAIEVAPTTVWERPLEVDRSSASEYRSRWTRHGVAIVAIQSLLYGRPDLTLFQSSETRRRTLEYLCGMMRLAGWLGAGPLVFGSPKNRVRAPLSDRDAFEVAVDFFRRAAGEAVKFGTVLCLEPNPIEYGCDFVLTSAEGHRLVGAVDHPGFRLHLDAAAMTMAGEEPAGAIAGAGPVLAHFHASEPGLGALGEGGVHHRAFAAALRGAAYDGYVSSEMRPAPDRPLLAELRRVASFLLECYG